MRRGFLPLRELVRVPAPLVLPCPSGWGLRRHHLQPLGYSGSIVVEYHVVMCSPVVHIPGYQKKKGSFIYLNQKLCKNYCKHFYLVY